MAQLRRAGESKHPRLDEIRRMVGLPPLDQVIRRVDDDEEEQR